MAVDKKLLNQLTHADPRQRRKAIVALADCRDVAALRPLQDAAQNDSDAKIRDVAGRAAKHLKEQTAKAASFAARPEKHLFDQTTIRVSEKQMERARAYTDEAMSMIVAKDKGKAAKALAKALQADPSLKADQYFLSLVSSVFDTSGEEGIEKLISGQSRGEFISAQKQSKIQKRKTDHNAKASEIGWSAVVFDLVVYAVVIGIITFLAPFVFTRMIAQAADYQSNLTAEKYEEETIKISSQLNRWVDDFQQQGSGPVLLGSVISAAGGGLGMLGLGFLIHLLASKVMGGTGTMPYMMSQLVPFYSLMTPVFFIWACILLAMVAVGAGLFGLLCLPIMGLANLVVFFKAAGKVGAAYDFGAAKGCMSLVVGSVALSLMAGLLSSLLFSAALSNAMAALGV